MRIKDLFSPARWRSFIIYLLQKALHTMGEEPAPQVHNVEQFMFRYLMCNTCLKNKKCTHCGCAIPGRMHVKTDTCSDGQWGVFMTEEEWNNYKENYKVSFKLKIGEDEYPI